MSETTTRRCGRGEDAIYFAAAKKRYVGSVSLGYGLDGKPIRRKVFGRTKQEVREKLKTLHQELNWTAVAGAPRRPPPPGPRR